MAKPSMKSKKMKIDKLLMGVLKKEDVLEKNL